MKLALLVLLLAASASAGAASMQVCQFYDSARQGDDLVGTCKYGVKGGWRIVGWYNLCEWWTFRRYPSGDVTITCIKKKA